MSLHLLQQRDQARRQACEALREKTIGRLRQALRELLPQTPVWIYGSLLIAGEFCERSDVDLALEKEPSGVSIYVLQSLLSARVGREVDICVLEETRLRAKIVQTGQRWIE